LKLFSLILYQKKNLNEIKVLFPEVEKKPTKLKGDIEVFLKPIDLKPKEKQKAQMHQNGDEEMMDDDSPQPEGQQASCKQS